jgi:hypothetical protein
VEQRRTFLWIVAVILPVPLHIKHWVCIVLRKILHSKRAPAKETPVIVCRGDVVIVRDSDVGEGAILKAHRGARAHIEDSFVEIEIPESASAENCPSFIVKRQWCIVSCES